ncbi:MAG: efflux RND transporter periplasmic adaptor subunit [Planctomycetes bacterium]|nr:efflux RND transporter periplasmic adaptor subunit [Planctomycetota bacterium]
MAHAPLRRPVLLACALAALAACRGGGGQGPGPASRPSGPAVPVRVAKVAAGDLPRVAVVSGSLAAEDRVVLGMKIAGRLGAVPVDLGTRVAQGEPLARLDTKDFELAVRQASAAVQAARARLGLPLEGDDDAIVAEDTAVVRQARATRDETRTARDRRRELYEQRLVPLSELEVAEAAHLVAESRYQDALEEIRTRQATLRERRVELAIAQQRLADSVLSAPFAGAVERRHALTGEYVAAGAPVVTLVRLHPLRLRLQVPERESAGVRVGQPIRLRVEGLEREFTGRVARLSPAVSEGNRTLLVEGEVPNPEEILRPGAFARAEIVIDPAAKALLVPAAAVQSFAGVERVVLVIAGRAADRRVVTGRRTGQHLEVLQGLGDGDIVVLEPGSLSGGQPVTVQEQAR